MFTSGDRRKYLGAYKQRHHQTVPVTEMANTGSKLTLQKIICLVFLYSTLWTLMLLSFSNQRVFLRQNDLCLQAKGDHICRDARVSGSQLDVRYYTTTVTPTSKPIPQKWIPGVDMSLTIIKRAGRLLGSGLGEEIDAVDCVIRMNGAPTKTYENDVGNRTTFRVIGHRNFPRMMKSLKDRNHFLDDEATRSDVVVVWHYGVNWKHNSPAKWCKAFSAKFRHATVYLASEDVMTQNEMMFYKELNISKSTLKQLLWMSTGWGAMLFALDTCETIDVYGMIYEDFCSEHPNDTHSYHYFDKFRTECSYYSQSEQQAIMGHKFLTEKAVFAKWAAMYGIVFHEPTWSGHMEGVDGNTVIDTMFKRTFQEYEQKKLDEANNGTTPNDTLNS